MLTNAFVFPKTESEYLGDSRPENCPEYSFC